MLIATQSNGKGTSFASSDKRVNEKCDLTYLEGTTFRISQSILRDIQVGEGFTCGMNNENTELYVIKVHANNTNPKLKALFCKKRKENAKMSSYIKSSALKSAMNTVFSEGNYFTFEKSENQNLENCTIYRVVPYVKVDTTESVEQSSESNNSNWNNSDWITRSNDSEAGFNNNY